jgi:hypothetical protein
MPKIRVNTLKPIISKDSLSFHPPDDGMREGARHVYKDFQFSGGTPSRGQFIILWPPPVSQDEYVWR